MKRKTEEQLAKVSIAFHVQMFQIHSTESLSPLVKIVFMKNISHETKTI